MKDNLTWLVSVTIIIALTLLRDASTNSTIDTLIALAGYFYFGIAILCGVFLMIIAIAYKDEPARLLKRSPALKKKLTYSFYTRAIVTPILMLGLFIHVQWTAMAILYIMSYLTIHLGAKSMRDIVNNHRKEAESTG